MAFPTIPTVGDGRVITSVNTAPAGTHTFPDLSGLTKASGDLLIAIVGTYQGNSTNAEFSSWGGGFTEFADYATTTGVSIGLAYKWSTGSETGTFTVTSANTGSVPDSGCLVLAIPGAHAVTVPEAGGFVQNINSNADSGSLDPSGWGVEDTLWITVAGVGETATGGAFQGINNSPTGYTTCGETGISEDVVGGMEVGAAALQSAAASADPPVWNTDTSNARWGALTIAVRPAPVAVTGSSVFPITFGSTTSARLGARGATTSAYTASETTTGRLGAKGAVDLPLAYASTTQGARTVTGSSILALTTALTTSGTRTSLGSIVLPLTWDAVTDGDIAGGGADWYGEVASAYTYGSTVQGRATVYAHPLSDAADGAWTTQTGGSDLANQLDEHLINDGDYIRSELRPVDSACRMKLEPLTAPDVDKYHALNWRIAKSAADGNTVDMELRLYQGGAVVLGAGTLIASWNRLDVSEDFTTYHEDLSEAEAASISNYADLYVEIEATVS